MGNPVAEDKFSTKFASLKSPVNTYHLAQQNALFGIFPCLLSFNCCCIRQKKQLLQYGSRIGWWEFNFKGCIPKVHCDYVDIRGRGKRCCGDSLRMVVFPWMENVCDVKEPINLSPGLSEDGASQIQRPLHVVFTTDGKKKKKQRKGFKCEVTCEE